MSKSCRSFIYSHHSPPSFHHSGNNCGCPGHSQREHECENLHRVCSPEGPFLSSGGSSTYGSMDGNIGDSISYTRLDSDPSLETSSHQVYERQVPFNEALFRAVNQLPSINDNPIGAGELLNLSRNGSARSEGAVKVEPRGCCNGFRCGENGAGCGCRQAYGQCSCTNCHHAACRPIKQETECEQRETCAGQNHTRSALQAERASRPTFEVVKYEPLEGPNDKVPRPEKNSCTKENIVAKGDDTPCCCLTNANFCAKIAPSKAGPTGDSFRHARDNVVQYPLGKRITHPVLKVDIDDKDVKKNPDGTNPVRSTGSSYGVVQQSPFKKGT